MSEVTSEIPKPLAEIKGKPILLHIMNMYKNHNIKEFILLLGYKGDKIKEFFLNYKWKKNSFTLDTRDGVVSSFDDTIDFNITFLETGEQSQTGCRLAKAKHLLSNENFVLTYGDGLSNVDVNETIAFHKKMGTIATLTGIKKKNQYGILKVEEGIATSFEEKGECDDIINGGFFVFTPRIFDYLSESEDCTLEDGPLQQLANDRQLSVYLHNGFWKSIDTYKELMDLNNMELDFITH